MSESQAFIPLAKYFYAMHRNLVNLGTCTLYQIWLELTNTFTFIEGERGNTDL